MNVERVQTANGSHIEPPLDQAWSDLKKLQWHCAVARVDCGLEVHVEYRDRKHRPITESDGGRRLGEVIDRITGAGYFNVMLPGFGGSGPHTFQSAWKYINGISMGANAVRRSAHPVQEAGDE